ncbi:putative RNA-binding protein with PIN domain [Kribbella sp. VKM Ac-2527]|uniref:Putative RNA-binding protein with PIN domain n=1 Tax=Kribbella caucasensis TaxID=2512215 RepID=A0A4R6J3C0_9ACTN|nr:NYN domain-containing protein [Kribbella sp. VKM Ac-2527]TDO29832.1 putative RNA-binding protein with PIN domain [Kribbella sp. VKM Ac-2527]
MAEAGTAAGSAATVLPEPVRQRVLSLAAQALGQLPATDIPPPLRRFASFAPGKRAKLSASVLGPILETDEHFRRMVGFEVRREHPELADAVAEGVAVPAAEPVEVAALAYLLRPDDWEKLVAAAAQIVPEPVKTDDQAISRLADQLDQARTETRQVRERLREQVSELKAENTTLRRKLNEARQRITGLQQNLELRTAEAESADERVDAARADVDRELRRLRARITELEAVEHAARRTAGQERELASTRTRLLLDTLVEAAAGLRRELALPPGGELRPADTVAGVEPSAAPVGRSAPDDDPALFDELLALPQVHLIVDGYNVTKTAWPTSPLHSQRQRLVTALGALVAQRRVEVTVVFDGAELSGPVQLNSPRGVRVRFSPAGVIADEVIRQLVRAEPPGRPVVVVSSDREVADSIKSLGARALSAATLISRIGRA